MQSLGYDVKNQMVYQVLESLVSDGKRLINFDTFLDLMTAKMVWNYMHSEFTSAGWALTGGGRARRTRGRISLRCSVCSMMTGAGRSRWRISGGWRANSGDGALSPTA